MDSAWIAYNKPKSPELANEYAGFLMALGLNGHLTKLATLNIHDYLTKVCACVHLMSAETIGVILSLFEFLRKCRVNRVFFMFRTPLIYQCRYVDFNSFKD